MLQALNVVVGLAAVYTAFSLFASWINESFNGLVQLRARTLKAGIQQMIGDASTHAALYGQPTIQAAKTPGQRDPSYLSANQFSLAVMSLLDGGGAIAATGAQAFANLMSSVAALPPMRLKTVLSTILSQADGEVEIFVTGTETWFDDQMQRVSGWYKRNSQIALLVIGALLAIAFNVDSLRVAHNFIAMPLVLDVARMAGDQSTVEPYVTNSVFTQVTLGWPDSPYCPLPIDSNVSISSKQPCWEPTKSISLVLKVLGVALTAIALSLGAPFWFDTLSRFVNVRSAGPPPKKADDA
jgi:hypothetical protein